MNLKDLNQPQRQAWPGLIVMYFRQLRNWFNAALALALPALAGWGWNNNFTYIGLGALLIFIGFYAYRQYKNFYFLVDDGKFIIHKGVFRKDELSVPFARIQTVNIKQNIIQQILNVVALEVETAGSAKQEVEIPSLSRSYAEALKSYLLEEKQATVAEQNLGAENGEGVPIREAQITEKGQLLLQLGLVDILKVGLTENHLRTGLVALAVLWSYFSQYQNYLEDQLGDTIAEVETAMQSLVFIIPILVLTFVLISVLLSLGRSFLRYFDLKMYLSQTGLTISSGLLKKQENVVPANKIQYISWRSNPLRKLLRFESLSIHQASSAEENKKQMLQVPGCKTDQIESINEAFFPEYFALTDAPEIRPQEQFKVRLLLFFAAVPTLILAVFLWFWQPWLLVALPIFTLVSVFCWIQYAKRFWVQIGSELLVIHRGYVFPQQMLLKKFKLQGVSVSQSFFQKRHQLVSLSLFTASGVINIPFVKETEGYALMNDLLYHIESSDKPWM